MASETSTPLPTHEPPSLPASPLPKRTKHVETIPPASDSGFATPTPLAMSLQPPAPIAPSVAAAASEEMALQVQLLSDKAKAPTKGSAFAAGHDLYSAREVIIPKRGRARVDTDISIAVPVGTCELLFYNWLWSGGERILILNLDGRVAPRSGLAAKHGIDTMAGVIDADYRGQVGVILANLSDEDFEVKIGDRIAQLIVEKVRVLIVYMMSLGC